MFLTTQEMDELRHYIEDLERNLEIERENVKHEHNRLRACENSLSEKINNFTAELKERGDEIASKDDEIGEWKERHQNCEKYAKKLERKGWLFGNRTFTFIFDAVIFTGIMWAGGEINE
jgi:chromosome segregation ATPase